MKVFQITPFVKYGSVGRFADQLGDYLIENNHKSIIAYSRGNARSNSVLFKIGNRLDTYLHGFISLFLGKHGFGSIRATKRLIIYLKIENPDIILLHNIHGYYLNLEILFNFLKTLNKKVYWILYDCWPFTGHCSYFDDINCTKWKTQCIECPKIHNYPKSFIDNSFNNYSIKKSLFSAIDNIEIIAHSQWLKSNIEISFLTSYIVHLIPSGINLNIFKPSTSSLIHEFKLHDKKVLLGCANIWSTRKGLNDFIAISKILNSSFQIVLIGLNDREIRSLPNNIIAIKKTNNINDLANWYSLAYVFINPTTQDNFPTTNLEALACGTPVITFNTGGSPEAIDENTGFVVNKGDIEGVINSIKKLETLDYGIVSKKCKERAEAYFNQNLMFHRYLELFDESLI